MSSDDLTKQTPTADRLDELISLVHRIISDITELKTRLTTLEQKVDESVVRLNALEQKVDERLHDTRPIWEAVQSQITELRNEMASSFRKFDRKFDVLQADFIDIKYKQRELESRLDKLEEKAS